ncbi:uncharacterized protein MONBRDRAFT_36953 [Monosiga brevicollis MX1]|uniref:TATA-box-binding protein n=1 Tax=Monosiga brevicollis TaxID=81824 RepID=A9UYM2_MONBE|nr:uncharacterized protein MONBRDRAFT_36953 [Monosiga brevicollis MX1]EDQ89488.1 predicted protein [Monosiga brevicollis MX1]|eukprot:XP_001745517.1 hypothetical protein [Monosiga brevicollis MX1]
MAAKGNVKVEATENSATSLPTATDVRPADGITPTVENVVATGYFSGKVNLAEVQKKTRNIEYNPRRFAACVIRNKLPHSTGLLFSSGKLVIMGCKSEEQAEQAWSKFQDIVIKRCNIAVTPTGFKIHNVVGKVDVGFKIDLHKLHMEHSKFVTYDPETFPGLTYRMQDPSVVLLVFHSGKVVLTKAKTRLEMIEGLRRILPTLKENRSSVA